MIIRIVRMTFEQNKTATFLKIFNDSKAKIRLFEGCTHLELLKDVRQENVYSTYSHWESEAHLNQYRNSELFVGVWKSTKVLFADKPVAHSYEKVADTSVL